MKTGDQTVLHQMLSTTNQIGISMHHIKTPPVILVHSSHLASTPFILPSPSFRSRSQLALELTLSSFSFAPGHNLLLPSAKWLGVLNPTHLPARLLDCSYRLLIHLLMQSAQY
jgi:hypothetical protein